MAASCCVITCGYCGEHVLNALGAAAPAPAPCISIQSCSNRFVLILADGTVVTLPTHGGGCEVHEVQQIQTGGEEGFAAVCGNGKVVCWACGQYDCTIGD